MLVIQAPRLYTMLQHKNHQNPLVRLDEQTSGNREIINDDTLQTALPFDVEERRKRTTVEKEMLRFDSNDMNKVKQALGKLSDLQYNVSFAEVVCKKRAGVLGVFFTAVSLLTSLGTVLKLDKNINTFYNSMPIRLYIALHMVLSIMVVLIILYIASYKDTTSDIRKATQEKETEVDELIRLLAVAFDKLRDAKTDESKVSSLENIIRVIKVTKSRLNLVVESYVRAYDMNVPTYLSRAARAKMLTKSLLESMINMGINLAKHDGISKSVITSIREARDLAIRSPDTYETVELNTFEKKLMVEIHDGELEERTQTTNAKALAIAMVSFLVLMSSFGKVAAQDETGQSTPDTGYHSLVYDFLQGLYKKIPSIAADPLTSVTLMAATMLHLVRLGTMNDAKGFKRVSYIILVHIAMFPLAYSLSILEGMMGKTITKKGDYKVSCVISVVLTIVHMLVTCVTYARGICIQLRNSVRRTLNIQHRDSPKGFPQYIYWPTYCSTVAIDAVVIKAAEYISRGSRTRNILWVVVLGVMYSSNILKKVVYVYYGYYIEPENESVMRYNKGEIDVLYASIV